MNQRNWIMAQQKEIALVEDFTRHYCIVCKKRIMVVCGTPVVHIGGCCIGVESNKTKTNYLRTLKCHIWCWDEYRKKKKKLPLKWKIEDVEKVLQSGSKTRQGQILGDKQIKR